MRTLSCAVVGTTGVNIVAVEVPASPRYLARLLKCTCPREFRGVKTGKTKLFGALEHGQYIESSSFELGLLPECLEEGDFSLAQSILSDWQRLNLDAALNGQLPASGGGGEAVVHVVAVIPIVKIACLANSVVVRVVVNKSASVGELKDEIKTFTSERIKLVEAKIGEQQLTRDDVKARRSSQVTNFLRALAAKEEIDLSRTVESVFGDATGGGNIHVLATPCEIVFDHQYQTSMNGNRPVAVRGRRT